jgi:hypothetical protein
MPTVKSFILQAPGVDPIKLFTFSDKSGAYPSEASFSGLNYKNIFTIVSDDRK